MEKYTGPAFYQTKTKVAGENNRFKAKHATQRDKRVLTNLTRKTAYNNSRGFHPRTFPPFRQQGPVVDLKAKYPHITLESAIPCETQAAKWSEPLRDRYFKIAEQCDKETMLQTQYTPDCMQKRNRYMVDQADVLLAVWDGTPSGTGSTVQYARTQGKMVWILNPFSFEVNYTNGPADTTLGTDRI